MQNLFAALHRQFLVKHLDLVLQLQQRPSACIGLLSEERRLGPVLVGLAGDGPNRGFLDEVVASSGEGVLLVAQEESPLGDLLLATSAHDPLVLGDSLLEGIWTDGLASAVNRCLTPC